MKSLKEKTTSLFGSCPDIFRKRLAHWKYRDEIDKNNFLIIDDKDGRLALCPLRYGKRVTIYESNAKYLDGGKFNIPMMDVTTNEYVYKEKTCIGLRDRLNIEFLENLADIKNENFYSSDINDKYTCIAVSKSLDREENKNFTMEYKINKLKNLVKDGGYLYIEYYIALDNDEIRYPKNQYLRYGEMEKYFDPTEWNILSLEEISTKEALTKTNVEEKPIIFGIIDVRKKFEKEIKKIKKKQEKNILSQSESRSLSNITPIRNYRERKVRNYVINGVLR